MKLTIEAETDEEREQVKESIVYSDIIDFAVIGRNLRGKIYEDTFSHLHVSDKYTMEGKLYELIARLRDVDSNCR